MITHPVVTSSVRSEVGSAGKRPCSTAFAIFLLGILLISPWGCQPDLQQIECVGSWCPNGLTCLNGRCWNPEDLDLDSTNDASGDLDGTGDGMADVDTDGQTDTSVDGPDTPTVDSIAHDPDSDIEENPCYSDLPLEEIEESIIVYIDAAAGDGGIGTADDPVGTFSSALVVMAGPDDQFILVVTADEYAMSPTVFRDMNCFEIRGGYTRDDRGWKLRDPLERTVITSDKSPVLSFESIAAEVTLSRVEVNAPSGRTGRDGVPSESDIDSELEITTMEDAHAGENSVGISAIDTNIVIVDSVITTGNGGDGGRGYFGQPGADGVAGDAGAVADTGTPECGIVSCAPGGDGGTAPDPCWSVTLRGEASNRSDSMGGAGGDGSSTAGEVDPGQSGGGSAVGEGAVGEDGWEGNGGGGYGYLRDRMWHPVPGVWAGPGEFGGGGAGGNGGVASNTDTRWSGGGGGGGSGGCGGHGGGGGGGGGGSIGIYLEDSTLVLIQTDVHAGDGGTGGDGGEGAAGGGGGPRGEGGVPIGGSADENGQPGFQGGMGGAGGHGGGGGGGISAAIVQVGDSRVNNDDAVDDNLNHGNSGPGGAGEDDNSYSRGADGIANRRLKFSMVQYAQECPYNSVLVERFDEGSAYCVDVFEATRADDVFGQPTLETNTEPVQAISVPAILPWRNVGYWYSMSACLRGGGFLCDRTWLQSICEDSSPDLTVDNCNFDGGEEPAITGYYAACVADFIRYEYHTQVFDLFGNVAEWVLPTVDDSAEQEAYGGGFAGDGDSVDCAYTLTLDIWSGIGEAQTYTDVGFRCCYDGVSLEGQEFRPDEE